MVVPDLNLPASNLLAMHHSRTATLPYISFCIKLCTLMDDFDIIRDLHDSLLY